MTDLELAQLTRELFDAVMHYYTNEYSPYQIHMMRDVVDFVETIKGIKPCYGIIGMAHHSPMEQEILARCEEYDVRLYPNQPHRYVGHVLANWPKWMVDRLIQDETVNNYILANEVAEQKFCAIQAVGRATIEQEAELLHYPICCVREYHERHATYAADILQAYQQASDNDMAKMLQLIDENTAIWIDPQKIRDAYRNGQLSPLCSFAYCGQCAGDVRSPGQQINSARANFLSQLSPQLLIQMQESAKLNNGKSSDCSDEHIQWSEVQSLFSPGMV